MAFQGSFRKRERPIGKQKGGCRKESGRFREEKRCSPIVLQSGPLPLQADKDQGCNHSNFVLVLECNGHASV